MPRMKNVSPAGSRETPKRRTPATQAAPKDNKRVIDFDRYIPTVVLRLITTLRASAQLFFDERFGITRLDWRIISFIASEGPSSAYDIWTLGNLDKAAVSRALKILAERKLVTISQVARSTRRRTVVSLTRQGQELSDQTFVEVIKRHDRLLGGLSRKQVEDFILTARHLESRIPFMDKDSEFSSSNFDATKKPNWRKASGDA